MNDFLDKLQQAWQSQCSKPIDVKPEQLLKVARYERLVYFCVDIGMISFFFCVGILTLGWVFRDIQRHWPWLISATSALWVMGYILFNRWRRRRGAAHYEESLLGHVEWSIKDIEHQAWLDRHSLWWYILPLALGCMFPSVVSFAMDCSRKPEGGDLFALLFGLLSTLGVFVFVYLVMQFGVRLANEKRRQELQALRALRETILSTDE